jgi:L-tyrosine isonitrile synthase
MSLAAPVFTEEVSHSDLENLGRTIFDVFSPYLRKSHPLDCPGKDCGRCMNPHMDKILVSLSKGEAPIFVLPAFPGKSPNRSKVLGHLPDEAERSALRFLGSLCARVREFYEPGIRILICSDGRVFSDVVGMKEEDISEYQSGISKMIRELRLLDISTFNLDDCYPGVEFDEMRRRLLSSCASNLEELKERIRSDQTAKSMYMGMTRFLFEDALSPEQTKTRSAVQRDARRRAYEVIQRSNAWSELIGKVFPEAVRLSIHPQVCGSMKLGIRLIGDETWITPWHGVIVKTPTGVLLLKRSDAEALGARLVLKDGEASHFELGMNSEDH